MASGGTAFYQSGDETNFTYELETFSIARKTTNSILQLIGDVGAMINDPQQGLLLLLERIQ